MKKEDIINAYCRIRTIDHTIPDDVLDFMKDAAIEKLEGILTTPDIRNKLSPITHLISMLEIGEVEFSKEALPQVKDSINYLAGREVYENTKQ